MKTKITVLLIALSLGFNMSYGQEGQNEDCVNNLSLFDTSAKSKKFDDAYGPWMAVREECPKFHEAIYSRSRGQAILKHKIEQSSGAEKVTFIKDLLKVHEQYNEYYSSKQPIGKMLTEKGLLTYKHKKELGTTNDDVYNLFDEAYKKDLKNFTNAQALYIYFSIEVDLFDAGKREAQQLFDKYDDVKEKIESEITDHTNKLNKLVAKEEAGTALTKREASLKRFSEQNLVAYDKVSGSIDTKIGDRATCEVLIPLYQKDFEENKNDAQWLQRAMNRMFNKGCKEDPLFVKLVEQKNNIEPTANTTFYLYTITGEQKYLDQTIQLEKDPLRKAKLYKNLANEFRSKGSYGKARQYYREALKLNPSDGSPYLRIASMYARSAKNCGDTPFKQRAVYWLAASEARKAGRADARLKKAAAQNAESHAAKAPSKADIFSENMGGKVIKVGCWIGASVTVPKN